MRMQFVVVFLLILFSTASAQQNTRSQLDSMYNEFIFVKNHQSAERSLNADSGYVKCGFGIINSVIVNLNLFTPEQQAVINSLLDRPVTDTSVVTPSKFFKIHYDVFGTQMLKYDINELMKAADSSLYFETNFLAYPLPPKDDDGYYHIYITNLGGGGGGLYGYTQFEDEISPGSGTFHSYMMIDNDYAGYYSAGINGAMVTVAHELHHAIQVGNYLFREEDLFYFEMSSTAMEEFVFDSVNDYYAYMKDYFRNTSRAFANNTGYDIAVWNIFLADRFGYDILKRQWDLLKNMRALNSIANSLLENNSIFGEEFRDFGIACFFTNYRSDVSTSESIFKFEEAVNYPAVKPLATLSLPTYDVNMNSFATANNYLRFVNNIDTLITLVSNSDYKSGIDSLNILFPFRYHIYDGERAGAYKLTSKYYAAFSAPKPTFWSASEIYNNTLVSEGNILAENVDYAFPSPFYYSKNSFIFIPVFPGQLSEVDLNIYTSSMDLIYSTRQNYSTLYGRFVVKWNATNGNGDKLPSGVYLYVTKTGDDIKKGKLVIFNE